ncbi:MAG: hypothetical protein K5Q00_03350, partial [Gammaproteobacteria bacterium]|nr:hypothetical protein [Gammaproteobacteria bacterium]
INISSVFINVNKEVLLNIMVRLFILGKIHGLLSVRAENSSTEEVLVFVYQAPDMLRAHAEALEDRTLNLPEMKMPFNLSVCGNYMKSIGGEASLAYTDNKSFLKLCFPIMELSA